MDKDHDAAAAPQANPGRPAAPPNDSSSTRGRHVTSIAVAAVVVTALAAALAPRRVHEAQPPVVASAGPAANTSANGSAGATTQPGAVVTAPPLAAGTDAGAPANTKAMGGSAACATCGVVENVVAVRDKERSGTDAESYLMNIRMDDGSSRTIQQRGALAAGSRVVVEGQAVRAMTPVG